MKPPRRDRFACFETTWPPCDREFRIASITVRHDCLNGDAAFVGVGDLKHPLSDTLREEIGPKLAQVGVQVEAIPVTEYMFKLSLLPGTRLKLNTHQEVISFINSIALAIGYPPSYGLKLVIEREVFTSFQSNRRRWMNEGEWLLRSTPLNVT